VPLSAKPTHQQGGDHGASALAIFVVCACYTLKQSAQRQIQRPSAILGFDGTALQNFIRTIYTQLYFTISRPTPNKTKPFTSDDQSY